MAIAVSHGGTAGHDRGSGTEDRRRTAGETGENACIDTAASFSQQNCDSYSIYQLKIFGHVGQAQNIRCTARLPLRDMCPAPWACDGAGPTVQRHEVRARGYASGARRRQVRARRNGGGRRSEVQGQRGPPHTQVLSGRPQAARRRRRATDTTCKHASAPEHSLDQTRHACEAESAFGMLAWYDVYPHR